MKEEFRLYRRGHGMEEVISWASAVFSLGWKLYESGQVMSHDIHAKMSKSHSPLALSSPAGITEHTLFSQKLMSGSRGWEQIS